MLNYRNGGSIENLFKTDVPFKFKSEWWFQLVNNQKIVPNFLIIVNVVPHFLIIETVVLYILRDDVYPTLALALTGASA